jgi:hypothetical protein
MAGRASSVWPSTSRSRNPIADRVLAGRYRLVEPIARGGMAEVWEAHDEVLARPVAVKILHPHLAEDPGFVERFRREAVAAARLNHPGIVATYDTGEDDGVAFIVMELVRGHTLRRALEESAPLPAATAVHIAAQVADALVRAHRVGMVHRDVKPANILLCDEPGGAVRVKVADFGIAKLQVDGADLTQTGAVVGTAKYLSPEQADGRSPDARSDVYALGVVLYEMLCGRPPFAADTELATALQHVQAEPTAPRRLRAGIPRPLEQVVLRAMAKEPRKRFQSAADLRGALLAVDLGPDDADPLVVREPTPPGGVALLARPGRPHWLPAVLVAGVVAGASVAALAVLSSDDDAGGGGRGAAGGQAVPIVAARSFDPLGDGDENEEDARLAVDGRVDTRWATSRYNTRSFGNLKEGVGLVVEVGGGRALRQLVVQSPTRGWAASVYLADRPGAKLSDWGAAVDRKAAAGRGQVTFDLGGRRGGAVLLWITDPGEGNRTEVAEVSVRS